MTKPTCIYLCSNLSGLDQLKEPYVDRYVKFLKFYRDPEIKLALGYDYFVFIDNSSPGPEIDRVLKGDDVEIVHCPRIERGFVHPNDYKYGWRMIWFLSRLQKKYDKFILLDSDSFILSKKLAHWVRDVKTGWQTLYSLRHQMPEANLSILTKEGFPVLDKYIDGLSLDDFIARENGKCMEKTLPFTRIEHDFVAERYGEGHDLQRPEMDAYFQCRLERELTFEK